MIRRPIFLGIIFTVVGAVGFVVSVVINAVTLGHFRILSNVLGVIMLASFPTALILELILWLRRK